jgi:hypothetical protein
MIVFVTMMGRRIKIRASADQDEFESAMLKDRDSAVFHVCGRCYKTRSVAEWTPRHHRGPYRTRHKFIFEEGE